jgi:hypothetical protein
MKVVPKISIPKAPKGLVYLLSCYSQETYMDREAIHLRVLIDAHRCQSGCLLVGEGDTEATDT